MRTIVLVAVAAGCSCSSKESRCEKAADLFLAQTQKRSQEVIDTEGDPQKRAELEAAVKAEMAQAKERFVPACTRLDAPVIECLERFEEFVALSDEAEATIRAECPKDARNLPEQACADKLRADMKAKSADCEAKVKPFFESLYAKDSAATKNNNP